MAQKKKPASRTRPKDDRKRRRTLGVDLIAAGAAAIGLGAAAVAVVFARRKQADPAGHAAPDLAADAPVPGTNRAPDAFRPDPTAPVPPEMRESLRPATGPAPSLAADRGTTIQ